MNLTKLTAWRDGLVEARANGIREFEDQNGERIVYKSDKEMAQAIADLERRIAAASRAAPHTILLSTSKGL